MTRTVFACAAVVALASAAPLRAQSGLDDPKIAGRFEASIGPSWVGAISFAPVNATETTPGGGSFVLFSTTDRLDSSLGPEVRLGFHVTEMFEIEAIGSYASPTLRTTVTNDVENNAAAVSTISVRQWTIGGAFVAHLRRLQIGSRTVPFVEAGAAYVRELYDTDALATSGQMYTFGGGVSYRLLSRPRRRPGTVGLRADARAVVRTKGVATDGRTHIAPAAAGGLFVRF